jgi:hypothetical protein
MIKQDYSVTYRDSSGRIARLWIRAASINEMVTDDYPVYAVQEDVELQAFQHAVEEGLISSDASLLTDFEANWLLNN